MSKKNLAILFAAAAALAVAAHFLGGASRSSAPALNGCKILPDVALPDVARIRAGAVSLAATDDGWVVESMHGYPADRRKILDNLRGLLEIKVGQVARGRPLSQRTEVALEDAGGRVLASVVLGERHPRWGFGRYVEFKGETVLVSDVLDAFDGDPKRWCETKIADKPWISFSSLAAPDTPDEATGFSTGVVAHVTVAGDTNCLAMVGNALPDGAGRYFRLDGQPWIYVVPSYSVDGLLPKPEVEPEKSEAEAPAPEAVSEASAPEAASEAPAPEAASEAPAPEAASEAPAPEAASEAPAPEAQ